ncbi:MAG: hypothetical protein EOL98_07760, partial [Negativicutes bacterium]|nr:hypothetical protein [Negativicutes bacterium]
MSPSPHISISRTIEFTLAFALVVFTTIAIRLTELPLWQDAAFFVNGERLMATHDAYTWLAGAKDIGNYASHPFSRLLAILHEAFGFSLADLGFWSPLFFVSLLAIPV